MGTTYRPLDTTTRERLGLDPDEPGFWFRWRDSRHPRRLAYSPDEEVRGVATLSGGALVIHELTLSRAQGLSAGSLQAVPLGVLRDEILVDLREHGLLDQLTAFTEVERRWGRIFAGKEAGSPAERDEQEERLGELFT